MAPKTYAEASEGSRREMSCLAECGHRWTQRKKKAIWAHGLMESLHCCQSGQWEEGDKGHRGRCAGEEGRDRCDNQVPCGLVACGSKFHAPHGLRIEASSDCVDIVAELMLY